MSKNNFLGDLCCTLPRKIYLLHFHHICFSKIPAVDVKLGETSAVGLDCCGEKNSKGTFMFFVFSRFLYAIIIVKGLVECFAGYQCQAHHKTFLLLLLLALTSRALASTMSMKIQSIGKMMKLLVMLLVFIIEIAAPTSASRNNLATQNLDVQTQLKRFNKPAVKSIKSPDGDIIDCIKLNHQPAFEHPLFKDHRIQMSPKFHPERAFDANKVSATSKGKTGSSSKVNQMWHLNGRCPKGTIPMRRTKKDDLLRASTIKAFGKKKHKTIPQPRSADPDFITQSGHQHAIAYVDGDKYYGAKATVNVWEPKIQQPNEFSLSQIWILGGSFGEDLNSIEAGWQVSPDLYGDNHTRLFTYWTSDAYQATGCYNLFCSGFIQINNEIAMGASIYPVSSYHDNQYDISLLVWKDPTEGNWWLQFGNNYVLGYWPAFLFSYLSDSASMIEWGGEVVNSQSDGQHTSTQMGSGHFPNEGFGKASYFKNIQIVDGNNKLRFPKDITTFTEQSNCYDVKVGKGGNWGNYFYYGGPGRNPNCP